MFVGLEHGSGSNSRVITYRLWCIAFTGYLTDLNTFSLLFHLLQDESGGIFLHFVVYRPWHPALQSCLGTWLDAAG